MEREHSDGQSFASAGSPTCDDADMPNFADMAAPSLANFDGYEPDTVFYAHTDNPSEPPHHNTPNDTSKTEDSPAASSGSTMPIKARLQGTIPSLTELPDEVRSLLSIKKRSDISRMGIVHYTFADMSKESEIREIESGGPVESPSSAGDGSSRASSPSPAAKRFGAAISSVIKGVVLPGKKRKRVLVVCTYSSVYMCDASSGKVVRFIPYSDISGLSLAEGIDPLSSDKTSSMILNITDEDDAVLHFAPEPATAKGSPRSKSPQKALVPAGNIAGGALKWFNLPPAATSKFASTAAAESGVVVARVVQGMFNTISLMQDNHTNASECQALDNVLIQSVSETLTHEPSESDFHPTSAKTASQNINRNVASALDDDHRSLPSLSILPPNTSFGSSPIDDDDHPLPLLLPVHHVSAPTGLSPAVFLIQQRCAQKQQQSSNNTTSMGSKDKKGGDDSPFKGGSPTSSKSKGNKDKIKEKMARATNVMAGSAAIAAGPTTTSKKGSSSTTNKEGGVDGKVSSSPGKSPKSSKVSSAGGSTTSAPTPTSKQSTDAAASDKKDKKKDKPSTPKTPAMSQAEIALALATGMPIPASAMGRHHESSDEDEDAMKEFYKHQSDNDKDREKKKHEKKKEREAAFIKELEAKRQEVIKAAMDVLSNLKKELEPNDFGQIRALEKKEKREIADEERRIRRRQRRLAAGWTMEMVKAEEEKLILEARTKRDLRITNKGGASGGGEDDAPSEVDSDQDAMLVEAATVAASIPDIQPNVSDTHEDKNEDKTPPRTVMEEPVIPQQPSVADGSPQPSTPSLEVDTLHDGASSSSSSTTSMDNNHEPESTLTILEPTPVVVDETDSSFSLKETPNPYGSTAPNSQAASPDRHSTHNPPTSHHRLNEGTVHDIRNLTVGGGDDNDEHSLVYSVPTSPFPATTTTTTSVAEMAALEERLTTVVKDSSAKDMKVVFEQLAEMRVQQQQVHDESLRLRGDLREFMEKVATTSAQQQLSSSLSSSPESINTINNAAIVASMEASAAAAAEKHNKMLVESEVRIGRMLSGLVSKLEGQHSSQINELKESVAETLRRVEERVLSLETASKNIRTPSSSEEVHRQYTPSSPSAPLSISSDNVSSKSIYASGGTRRPSAVVGNDVRSVAPMTGRSQSPPANPNLPGGGRAVAQSSPSVTTATHRSESSARRVEEEAAASQAAIESLQDKLHSLEQRHRVESARARELEASYAELRASVATERRNATSDVEAMLRTQQAYYERQLVEQQGRVAMLKSEAIATNQVLREVSDDFAFANMKSNRSLNGSQYHQLQTSSPTHLYHQSAPVAVSQPIPPPVQEDEALALLHRQYPHLFSTSSSTASVSSPYANGGVTGASSASFNHFDHYIGGSTPVKLAPSRSGAGRVTPPSSPYRHIDPGSHSNDTSNHYRTLPPKTPNTPPHQNEYYHYTPHPQSNIVGSFMGSQSHPVSPSTMSKDALSVLQALQRRKAMRNDI